VNKNAPDIIKSTDTIANLVDKLHAGNIEIASDRVIRESGKKIPTNYKKKITKLISMYDVKVPLYDIGSNRIFLIYHDNVYSRVYRNDYRFVTQQFYDEVIKIKHPDQKTMDMINFLSHYDFDILEKTYNRLFYKSFAIKKYITTCRRPSFMSGMEHIQPYYKMNELYYLAQDWEILKGKPKFNDNEVDKICLNVSKFDIPAQTLLDHQIYIYDLKSIGLVKHYSLYGSYYMNTYLRNNNCCIKQPDDSIRNPSLEGQIDIMSSLIYNSPPLKREHTVYRFVEADDYLRHLKNGDVYTDPSFMSTTRNPFYYHKTHNFGYILIKVTLPGNVKGICLCIESYSNFPEEQELILPPTSQLELINVTQGDTREGYQNVIQKKVIRKYEFKWVGNNFTVGKTLNGHMKNAIVPKINTLDMKKLMNEMIHMTNSIANRFEYFINTLVDNPNNQFISNGQLFTVESYDSSTVYRNFFYYEVTDGIMLTCSNKKYGNINLMLEISDIIHVNFYFKFSVSDSADVIDLDTKEWIEWLCMLSFVLGCRQVIIHPNYYLDYNTKLSSTQKQNATRYTYQQDIYNYLKHGTKRFDSFTPITINHRYPVIDRFFNGNPLDYVKKTDKNELFKVILDSNKTTLGDVYIHLVEHHPKMISTFQKKMFGITDSPFKSLYYRLDPYSYLYEQKYIAYIPTDSLRKGSFKKIIGDDKIVKFENRLRKFMTPDV
jgi:hypothetical protein